MKAIVNEPEIKYKSEKWIKKFFLHGNCENICKIENEAIMCYPLSAFVFVSGSGQPKFKLSSLKGKLSFQSSEEIKNQITDLRNEWNKNI